MPEGFKKLVQNVSMTIFASTAACIFIAIIIFSPLGLSRLSKVKNVNWAQLSNIGQTYGAISALLAGLALVGVIGSLIYQVRATKTASVQLTRTLHNELIQMEMRDPSLMAAVGAPWDVPSLADANKMREHLYIHMWVNYWRQLYILKQMNDDLVRSVSGDEIFRSNAAREYWQNTGSRILPHTKGREHRFYLILKDEYEKALTRPPIDNSFLTASQNETANVHRITKNPQNCSLVFLGTAVVGKVLVNQIIKNVRRRANRLT